MVDPVVILLFVNELTDALEALALVLTDDVKMVSMHCSIIAAWGWSKKLTYRTILFCERTSQLGV